jgi:hypothetical protein
MWKLYEKFPSVQKEFNEIQPLVLYQLAQSAGVQETGADTRGFQRLKVRVLGGSTEMPGRSARCRR